MLDDYEVSKMRYYAAINQYGDQTDIGYVNTWTVYVFRSRQGRDDWVAHKSEGNVSARAIVRSEIGDYTWSRPQPFSSDRWIIQTWDAIQGDAVVDAERYGMIGHISTAFAECVPPRYKVALNR